MAAEIAFVFAIVGFIAALLVLIFKLEDNHFLFKLLCLFFLFDMFQVLGQFGMSIAAGEVYEKVALIFFQITQWIFRSFVAYMVTYFVYQLLNYFGLLGKYKIQK